jgi:NitT/TauT family transport system substrate-binding protein
MVFAPSTRNRFKLLAIATVATAAVVLTGCAADAGVAKEADNTKNTKVTFVEGLDVFPYEVVSLGIEKGFFTDNGIDAEIIGTENEIQAIASNSAQFAIGGTVAILSAREAGIEVQTMFATMDGLGMNTIFSNELIEKHGLTIDAPLDERVRALKGETIGLTGPLGDDESFFRYFLTDAGLDPDNDVTFAYIGGTPDRVAAMEAGEIAAYMSSIPAAELGEFKGVGKRIIIPSQEDIPELEGIPYSGVHVMAKYANENPDVVKAVGKALSTAANFMRDEQDETIEFIQSVYPEYDKTIVTQGMEAIFPAVPENGRMTKAGWDNLAKVTVDAGVLEKMPDVTEDTVWTNKFLRN